MRHTRCLFAPDFTLWQKQITGTIFTHLGRITRATSIRSCSVVCYIISGRKTIVAPNLNQQKHQDRTIHLVNVNVGDIFYLVRPESNRICRDWPTCKPIYLLNKYPDAQPRIIELKYIITRRLVNNWHASAISISVIYFLGQEVPVESLFGRRWWFKIAEMITKWLQSRKLNKYPDTNSRVFGRGWEMTYQCGQKSQQEASWFTFIFRVDVTRKIGVHRCLGRSSIARGKVRESESVQSNSAQRLFLERVTFSDSLVCCSYCMFIEFPFNNVYC